MRWIISLSLSSYLKNRAISRSCPVKVAVLVKVTIKHVKQCLQSVWASTHTFCDFRLKNIWTFSFIWLFHLYDFFICMTFSSVWLFHLYDFFICMTFSSIWLFHLYEVFLRMGFAYGFCVWILRMNFAYEFCVWVLRMGFAYEFCVWVLRMSFAYGFCVWVFICELFHLWVFFAKYASEVSRFRVNLLVRWSGPRNAFSIKKISKRE
jgi:nitrate reductase NapE component